MRRLIWIAGFILNVAVFIVGCAGLRSEPPALVKSRGSGVINRLIFSSDGSQLAGFDATGSKICIYSAADLSVLAARKMKMGWPGPDVFFFSPDGTQVVVQSANRRKIEIWQPDTDRIVFAESFDKPAIATAFFTPDGGRFCVLRQDGVTLQWDAHSWTPLPQRSAPAFWNRIQASQYVSPVVSDDGSRIMVPGKSDLWLWTLETGDMTAAKRPCEHGGSFATNGDFTRIAVTCLKGLGLAIRAADIPTGRSIPLENAEFGLFYGFTPFSDFDHVAPFAISPNAKWLAVTLASSGPMRRSPECRIWNLDTGEIEWSIPSYESEWSGPPMVFSPDGKILAIGGQKIRLFRLQDLVQSPQP